MTSSGRSDLIYAAAQSIADTRGGDLLQDDGAHPLDAAAAFAIDGVLSALYPGEAARIVAADGAFTDFGDLTAATRDCAFAVGVAYGVLVAKAEG